MSKSLYKVAGYLRLSREDGDKEESDSISSQRSIIARKVEELGEEFELIDFYIDDGYTGLNTDRPSFQKMLADCEKGLINAIITKDLSRLSRNSFEANFYIEKYFLENNIRYISVLDNVDTYIKNSNNDMIQFKTLINDWYSKDISRKVKSSVWARKDKGLFLASLPPWKEKGQGGRGRTEGTKCDRQRRNNTSGNRKPSAGRITRKWISAGSAKRNTEPVHAAASALPAAWPSRAETPSGPGGRWCSC